MTDTKPEGPYEAEALGEQYAVFGPTVPERDHKDSQFYVGGIRKCVALSNALNFAYAEGFKAGRASRDRLKNVAKAVMIAMDIKKHRSPRGFFDMANPALEELDKALAEDEKNG